MSFDKPTRNALARMVGAARERLKEDITAQLQTDFRLQPDGTALPLDGLTEDQRVAAEELRQLLDHFAANQPSAISRPSSARAAASDRLVREIGFTVLNRLAALRLCEERGLVVECVRKGIASDGFRLFDRLTGGALGTRYQTYRAFLENLFDELALDLGVLFDRQTPLSHVFPTERAFEDVLKLLSERALAHLWTEDETIGWIYQYYNDEAERKRMREESQAPRNSRELAVRNQFFTPRYVVEFLTDNTLGRIWYEMRKSHTVVTDRCRYLVRRSKEVFLGDVEQTDRRIFRIADDDEAYESHPSELVKAVYRGDLSQLGENVDWFDKCLIAAAIPLSQALRWADESDPSDFSLLDEVWAALEENPNAPILQNAVALWMCLSYLIWTSDAGPYFVEPFERLFSAFTRAIKRHGLSSEPNAAGDSTITFIPHRAKKDPREIKMLDPAGGSGHFGLYCFDLFETIYAEAYDDPDLGPKLQTDYPDRAVFLRDVPRLILEHNIHIVDIDPRACQIAALALWLRAQRSWQQLGLKPGERPRITKANVVCAEPMPGEKDLLEEFVADLDPPELGELVRFVFERMQLAGEAGSLLKIEEDLREKIDAMKSKAGPLFAQGDFWENAEVRVLEALRDYAERAANGRATQRRLFVDDAVQGFAFIDLCLKKYDVVLMNPPFGEPAKDSKEWVGEVYPNSKNDVLGTFVERALQSTTDTGTVGAITARTVFMLSSMSAFRQEVVLRLSTILDFVDLGAGVLDSAMVKTAMYVLSKPLLKSAGRYVDLSDEDDKGSALTTLLVPSSTLLSDDRCFWVDQSIYSKIPGSPISYWADESLQRAYTTLPSLADIGAEVKQGLGTTDDFRFVRATWEVSPNQIGRDKIWVYYAKGGESSDFYSDIHLVVNWAHSGKEIYAHVGIPFGGAGAPIRNPDSYFRSGLTYTSYTNKGFSPRVLPSGCIFTTAGMGIFVDRPLTMLSLLNSDVIQLFLLMITDERKWEVGYVRSIPVHLPASSESMVLENLAIDGWMQSVRLNASDETQRFFASLPAFDSSDSLAGWIGSSQTNFSRHFEKLKLVRAQINHRVAEIYGVTESTLSLVQSRLGLEDGSGPDISLAEYGVTAVSYLVGIVCGRWDIRIALDPTLAPKLQDPFDPLPVCPPGMLVGPDGLPATPGHIVSEEWLRARPNAITLPDLSNLQSPITIPDSEYPLRIAWDGILVDDPGLDEDAEHPHPADIVHRVREALTVLWGDRAEAIEHEACEILGMSSLRQYFRKPSSFFADHLKRYSKSRRQAPIYWPLSTASGRYTVWLYYHRLTADTLYTVVNRYVTLKIDAVQDRVDRLSAKLESASGRAATQLRDQVADLRAFLSELTDFRAELLRVAGLPYKPDLNDGVIINAAPLHKLFRLRKWTNDTAAVWKKLEAGEYDWAHMAYTIWPKRVEKVCEKDRSIAIAHGLEHLCKVEKKATKAKRKKNVEPTSQPACT